MSRNDAPEQAPAFRAHSLLWHSSQAQADEISGLKQGADLWYAPISGSGISNGVQTGDARITIVAAQPSGFGELGGSPFQIAFETIGGGEVGVTGRDCRTGAARLFK